VRFVDCNGLAGAAACGFIQSGFELAARVGTLKLGAENMRANRALVGWDWEDQFSDDFTDWHIPDDVQVIVGTPPCSSWSTLTSQKYRGAGADVLKHTAALVGYAGRVAPEIVAFESVQQAYTTGREYMQVLRGKLEADTGQQYNLFHIKHNAASLGAAAQRKRYWWLASRIPFGMDPPVPRRVPTLLESIGDLRGLKSTWEKQPYVYPETWWSSRRRSPDGAVDGHQIRTLTHERRIRSLLDALDGEWPAGWREEDALRTVYQRYGKLPDVWKNREPGLVKKNFELGPNQTVRWHGNRPARVLTGAAMDQAIHPTELRLFTLREAFRIQGWPDHWRLWPSRDVATHPLWAGKAAPVDAARWLGVWVKQALDGQPGSMRGTPVGDREFLLDSTHNYRLAPYELGRRHPSAR
jgi:site-specific DNA-cytosine methylase